MASPRLPVYERGHQSEAQRRADIHREASLAWGHMTRGRAELVGVAMGVGESAVHKQGNPNEPQRPPVENLLLAILAALDSGADEATAYAPLDWLCHRLGRVAVALPTPDVSDDTLARSIATTAREFGEVLALAGERLGNEQRPLTHELEHLRDELRDSLTAQLRLVDLIERRAGVRSTLETLTDRGAARGRQ